MYKMSIGCTKTEIFYKWSSVAVMLNNIEQYTKHIYTCVDDISLDVNDE